MIYVVGSGPSGIACAQKLIAKGARVTMLDAGLQIEDARTMIVRRVQATDRSSWDRSLLSSYKEGLSVSAKGVKYKTAYGSLFPYKDIAPYRSVYQDVDACPSYAQGGFSNVWGASSVTYAAEDLKSWPVTPEQLKQYYDEVFSFMPVAGSHAIPGISERAGVSAFDELKMSRQVLALNHRIQNLSVQPGVAGFFSGGSRLAVGPCRNDASEKECVYCGLCMYGCPYSLIYNSSSTLEDLKRNKNFKYAAGIFVENLKETGGEVLITIRELSTGHSRILPAEKVYLGSGVLSSARILLRSYDAYDKPIFCLDSQYFLLPLISSWATKNAAREEVHTLAQLCLRIKKSSSDQASFLQIYGYNDLYQRALRSLFGFSYPVFQGFFNMLLERLFLVQGYLHSDYSSKIKIELKRNAGGSDELFLEGVRNMKTSAVLNDVLRVLKSMGRKTGVFPVTPRLDRCRPGRGYHSGGTFPMCAVPRFGESDLWGRPHGFKNVHLVDASVFPTIPAGPITVNVMANASRIADQSFQGTEG
jgi:choline dehydrogenase-like flavoprotein